MLMRLFLTLIFFSSFSFVRAQTPVLRPRPLTIDLANPKAGLSDLSKEEKKKWKELQKEKKKELRLQDKYFDYKLDSAQWANYEKYQKSPLNDSLNLGYNKAALLDLSKGEFAAYQSQLKSQLGVADSIDLTKVNDSSYFHGLSPDVQERLQNELALYTTDYTQFSPDSLLSLKALLLDSIGNPSDSAFLSAQEQKKQFLAQASNEALENQAQQQLSSYGPTSELGAYQQQEQMMFSSYDEMIASDKYRELMASMPGKKAEIESMMQDPKFDPEDLPIAESVFTGHEEKLAAALSTQEVIMKKPTFKEVLQEFVNQDMEGLQQKTVIQRFSLTGQIQLSNYDPLFIDYSPSIAYAITGKIRIGTGVTGRIKIGEGKDEEEKLFGYRGFLEYDILKNIYLHGEYERTGMKVTDPLSDLESRVWTDRWMLGLGTDIKMPGILKGTLLILYNFDDDLANSPNPRRFQIRYGVKLN